MNIGMIGDLAETGFGRVTRELAARFIEAGHDTYIIGINFLGREGAVGDAMKKGADGEGLKQAYDAIANDPVLSRAIPAMAGGDGMGHNLTYPFVTGQLKKGWKPDRLFLLADPVAALNRFVYDEGACRLVPTFNYVPIEGTGLSAFWREIWKTTYPIAMTEFGARELSHLLGRPVPHIYHGVSPAFRPTEVSPQRKAELFGEGRVVIFRGDRFVPRKGYPEYIEVIKRVVNVRPEALFVIHCSPVDEGGLLSTLIADIPGAYHRDGRWQHSQVMLTKGHDTFRGFSDELLNEYLNAADIYASTAYSEGFGLLLVEAATTGLPVVATDFGAIPEAVGLGGLLVPPRDIVPTNHGHGWAAIDIDGTADAIITLIDDAGLRLDLGTKGMAHTARFSWDKAALQFMQLMEDEDSWPAY